MRTNRALIEGVEKAERGAKQRADGARGELLNREISTRIEGDKFVSDLIAPGFARLRERFQGKAKNGQ